MYLIIPIMYFCSIYIGIADRKVDLFEIIGILTISIFWIVFCMKIADKFKNNLIKG